MRVWECFGIYCGQLTCRINRAGSKIKKKGFNIWRQYGETPPLTTGRFGPQPRGFWTNPGHGGAYRIKKITRLAKLRPESAASSLVHFLAIFWTVLGEMGPGKKHHFRNTVRTKQNKGKWLKHQTKPLERPIQPHFGFHLLNDFFVTFGTINF